MLNLPFGLSSRAHNHTSCDNPLGLITEPTNVELSRAFFFIKVPNLGETAHLFFQHGLNISVWTYISVGEQSFNHRVVVSRYPLCFQHQVEADVCAVTVAGEKHHSVTERDSLSCESTIQSQLT